MMFSIALSALACSLVASHPAAESKMHNAVSNLALEIDSTHLTGKVMAKMSPLLQDVKATAGEPIVLQCEITTTPTAVFYWTFNGKIIQGDKDLNIFEKLLNVGRPIVESGILESTYTIPCASAEDSGTYKCIAYNGHMTVESTAEVVVEGEAACKESRHSAPLITQWTESRFEMDGNTATLVCRADKKAEFTWTFDGTLIHTNEGRYEQMPNGDLMIKDIRWSDMGTYMCNAANKYGEDSAETFLYPTKRRSL